MTAETNRERLTQVVRETGAGLRQYHLEHGDRAAYLAHGGDAATFDAAHAETTQSRQSIAGPRVWVACELGRCEQCTGSANGKQCAHTCHCRAAGPDCLGPTVDGYCTPHTPIR